MHDRFRTGRPIPRALVVWALLSSVTACTSADLGPGTAWGNATTVEELRIGVENGPEEYMFGSVSSLAVSDAGTMYVAERQPPSIRVYDNDGAFVRSIGRQGQGPGEFSDRGGMAVRLLGDGSLAAWDLWNTRVSLFSTTGEFLDSFTASGLGCHRCMELDIHGNLYIRQFNRAAESEADVQLAKYSVQGERLGVVTFPLAEQEGRGFGLSAEGVGSPRVETVSTWSPLGYVVTGRTDTYEIEVRSPAPSP